MKSFFSFLAATALSLEASVFAALASQGPGVGRGDAGVIEQSSAKIMVGLLAVIVIFGVIKFMIRRFGAS